MVPAGSSILGVDYGDKRIGLALASSVARLAVPYGVITAADRLEGLTAVVQREKVGLIVIGWPRNMQGEKTVQTANVERFANDLRGATGIPVVLQDEALTSQKAEAELRARRKPYEKSDIDALSAAYILEDYLTEHAT